LSAAEHGGGDARKRPTVAPLMIIEPGARIQLVPWVSDELGYDVTSASSVYEGLARDDWLRLLDNGATADGAQLVETLVAAMTAYADDVEWHSGDHTPSSAIAPLLSMRMMAPVRDITLDSAPAATDDLYYIGVQSSLPAAWRQLATSAVAATGDADRFARANDAPPHWGERWSTWTSSPATLLRALYVNADYARFESWLTKVQRRATTPTIDVDAYLDQLDDTFGAGVSSRWVKDVVPLLGTNLSNLTLLQRRAVREIYNDVIAATANNDRVASSYDTTLFGGGAIARRGSAARSKRRR